MTSDLENELWRRLFGGEKAWNIAKDFIMCRKINNYKYVRRTLVRWMDKGLYDYDEYLFLGWITPKGLELGPEGPRR